jgi:hypothetical protein
MKVLFSLPSTSSSTRCSGCASQISSKHQEVCADIRETYTSHVLRILEGGVTFCHRCAPPVPHYSVAQKDEDIRESGRERVHALKGPSRSLGRPLRSKRPRETYQRNFVYEDRFAQLPNSVKSRIGLFIMLAMTLEKRHNFSGCGT